MNLSTYAAVKSSNRNNPEKARQMEFGPYDNKHMVGMQAGKIAMLMPPKPGQLLTPDEAIGLAAWLAIMAGDIDGERIAQAIEQSVN